MGEELAVRLGPGCGGLTQAEKSEALLWSQWEMSSSLVSLSDVEIRAGRNGNDPALILGTS